MVDNHINMLCTLESHPVKSAFERCPLEGGVRRGLIGGGHERRGVLTAGEAFDAKDFLATIPLSLKWYTS